MSNRKWSMDWICDIDTQNVSPFPLQFANCKRLEYNDAVYIFDEVGSGKTISSGLMALHYLWNHQDKKVLVITVPALCTPSDNAPKGDNALKGQFWNDWLKLPFQALGFTNRIKVINNHYSNIEKEMSMTGTGKWGLVIIDEAHKFLNMKNRMNQSLCGYYFKEHPDPEEEPQVVLKKRNAVEKVVFLTATPIHYSPKDLETYVEIAQYLIRRKKADEDETPILSDWITQIRTGGRDGGTQTHPFLRVYPEELICGRFDVRCPVTRYFKDTIQALRSGHMEKTSPRRLLADIWKYSDKHRDLWQHIREEYCKNAKNRFVVFVRYVKRDAKALEQDLIEQYGFQKYKSREPRNADAPTVAVVTGENSKDLGKYSSVSPERLPTVLILTYQVAEQGVNLPGYNHVVNYHVPAYPSSLEQRYGRIDRLNSRATEINIHFLLPEYLGADIDSINFEHAVWSYTRLLLSYLPAKNSILTESILDRFQANAEALRKYAEHLRSLLTEENLRAVIAANKREVEDNEGGADDPAVETLTGLMELQEFIGKNDIEFKSFDPAEGIKILRDGVNKCLARYEHSHHWSEGDIQAIYSILTCAAGDKIFYLNKDVPVEMPLKEVIAQALDTRDAIGVEDEPDSGCAAQIINSTAYQAFREEFHTQIAPVMRYSSYKDALERIYEQLFLDNRLEDIFYEGGHWNDRTARMLCQDVLKPGQARGNPLKDDQTLDSLYVGLCQAYDTLPFFQLCRKFRDILIEHGTDQGILNQEERRKGQLIISRNFKEPPFHLALWKLDDHLWKRNVDIRPWVYTGSQSDKEDIQSSIWYQERIRQEWELQLSEEFIQCIRQAVCREEGDPFRVDIVDKHLKASQWLRLVYQLTYNIEAVTYSRNSWQRRPTTLYKGFEQTSGGDRRNVGRDRNGYIHARPHHYEMYLEQPSDWWTKGIIRDSGCYL